MNHLEESKLIWGDKWDWYQKDADILRPTKFDELYRNAFDFFESNLYYDLLIFQYFCEFFGSFDEMFIEVLRSALQIDEAEMGKYAYRFLTNGTIIIEKEDSDTEYFLKISNNGSAPMLEEYSEAVDKNKILTLDTMWLDSWRGALELLDAEENYSGKYILHKFPQTEHYITPENILGWAGAGVNELYFFDLCPTFVNTIRYYGVPKNKASVEKLDPAIGIPVYSSVAEIEIAERVNIRWCVPDKVSENPPPLLVDPRLALSLREDFHSAKKEADARYDWEVIFTPDTYLTWLFSNSYDDLPVESIDKKEFMLRMWERIREQLLDDWTKKIKRELPKDYKEAIKEYELAQETFRNGDFKNAIIMAAMPCEWLCKYEFAKDYSYKKWGDIIDGHRDEIIQRYGRTVFYALYEIKDKRNKALHRHDYQPDKYAADDVLLKARMIFNHFLQYRIRVDGLNKLNK